MERIPFKVSARTALLIGRENVANAEGAVIELVKNSYDADATHCVLFFDNQYATIPQFLSPSTFDRFSKQEPLIKVYYQLNTKEQQYILVPFKEAETKSQEDKIQLQIFFRQQCSLYIMDNGTGMTDTIIRQHWMTIGTNYKESEIHSTNKRVRTGAKGIGRFALDRLGQSCTLHTRPIQDTTAFVWDVDWTTFEQKGQTLGEVVATLTKKENYHLAPHIQTILQDHKTEWQAHAFKQSGTILHIQQLRDVWNPKMVSRLFANLQSLIPPKEIKDFQIFVFSVLQENRYGKVSPIICDDFDYKLTATIDAQQKVAITLLRNEFDWTKINLSELFQQNAFQKKHPDFTPTTFPKKKQLIEKTLANLLPGISEKNPNLLAQIGPFEFTFYFLKNSITKTAQQQFKQKSFDSGKRKAWLKNFGGIKIYRDNFRIRPYGEPQSNAFDWLGLGQRATIASRISPTEANWKVRPQMIAGIIKLSRLDNLHFLDKSNREGLQENPIFALFKEVIIGLIEQFERDRYPIMQALDKQHKQENNIVTKQQQAKDIAKANKKDKKYLAKQNKENLKTITETVISAYESTEQQKKELENENKLLKALASTGLLLTTTAHELKNINNNLVYRMDDLKDYTAPLLDSSLLKQMPNYQNPLVMLAGMREDDIRLKHWITFALSSIRKDKRKRKKIDLLAYLNDLKANWQNILLSKKTTLTIQHNLTDQVFWKGFPIDLDTIFYNLIINSLEAFKRRSEYLIDRKIIITLQQSINNLSIYYKDTGPGLSPDIELKNADVIFEPHFTTKRDESGETIGTGLGMYIVKMTLVEYKTNIDITKKRPHFEAKWTFPIKTATKP